MNNKFHNYCIFGEETAMLSDCDSFCPSIVCFNFIYSMAHLWEILGLQPNALGKSGSAKASGDPSWMIWKMSQCFLVQNVWRYPWLSRNDIPNPHPFFVQTAADWQNAELFNCFVPQKHRVFTRISAALRLHLAVHLGSVLGARCATHNSPGWPLLQVTFNMPSTWSSKISSNNE